jgi:hypothetical protein
MACGEVRLARSIDREEGSVNCFFGRPRSTVARDTIHDAVLLEVAAHRGLRLQPKRAGELGEFDDQNSVSLAAT